MYILNFKDYLKTERTNETSLWQDPRRTHRRVRSHAWIKNDIPAHTEGYRGSSIHEIKIKHPRVQSQEVTYYDCVHHDYDQTDLTQRCY